MNGLDEAEEVPAAPQTFLYGCVLEVGKDVVFNPDDDEFEHQLDLKMACVDPTTKDELQMVEVEGQDLEGQKIKAALVSLKPSAMPSVCLGGFTITPPVVFRLKAGSGPIHLSGQHLVIEMDPSLDEEEEDEDEEEEAVKTSTKRPASSPADKQRKKMRMEADEDDDDDEEEEDDDEDEEDEEDEEEVTPVKAKQPPSKPKAAAQNGKSPKPTTQVKKEEKTPKSKGEKTPKTPPTPKEPLTLPQIKDKVLEAVKKGVKLPTLQPKFENFVKHSYRVSDDKILADLWKWRQTVKDSK